MNYLHVTILIASFDLNWPGVLQAMFNIHALLGSSGEQFMSLDCEYSQAYFKKVMMVAVLPVALLGINIGLWVLLYCLRIVREIHQKLICSLIVSLFYVHPNIVQISLSAFHCVTIEPGTLWLRDEMDIPCWDKTHSTYALGAALPSLILWAFGIPAVSLLILVRNRKRLSVLAVKQKVGFLYIGYKESAYFWELLIVFRKMSIILLYVFMSSEAVCFQALALCVLLWTAGNLQYRVQAFQVPELNRLEYKSIWVSIITIYSGVVFSIGDLSYEMQLTLAGLIMLANGNFLFLWVFYFFRACLIRIMKKYPRIERCFPFLRYQEAAVRSENRGRVHPEENQPTRTLPKLMQELYISKLYQQTAELPEPEENSVVVEFLPRRQRREGLTIIM